MTINGEAAATDDGFDVLNPATNDAFATAPSCSPDQLDAAMKAAATAFPLWRSDESARREAMRAAADALAAHVEALTPVLTAEQGKPLNEAAIELAGAAYAFTFYADLELPLEVLKDDGEVRVEVLRKPLGVVAAITPWNFPAAIACWKIAPALLAGNTVVLKPSPYTPLASLGVGEALRGVLPDGVLNVVTGGDDLGEWMTGHALPRKVSFTGSIAAGMKVAASAGADLKRVTLELGGNDPAILLDDIEPAAVAKSIFRSAFANNGQICTAVKRVYVHERVHDELVDTLAALARSRRVGDGTAPETQLGPINNRPQFHRVASLVDEALAVGATAAAGGRAIEGPGNFYEPTILVGATDGTRVVDEEQFGPALPVVAYLETDEVIARANASHYGLGGSVWSADPTRAAEVAEQLECGTAWVNSHGGDDPNLPFGGTKWSGLGVENGVWGVRDLTEMQVLHRRRGPTVQTKP
jgi:acyl-CoA reductase-like NAD-dependent aldehyde dehydrogenase